MGLICQIQQLKLRWLALGLIVAGLVNGLAAETDGVVLMENYCLDCHDSDTRKGEVNLEKALAAKP